MQILIKQVDVMQGTPVVIIVILFEKWRQCNLAAQFGVCVYQ